MTTSQRILVVEDEPDIALGLRLDLQGEGYAVEVVAVGADPYVFGEALAVAGEVFEPWLRELWDLVAEPYRDDRHPQRRIVLDPRFPLAAR